MPISGASFLIARIAWQTRLSGLSASLPSSSRSSGRCGEQRDARDVECGRPWASRAASSTGAARRPASGRSARAASRPRYEQRPDQVVGVSTFSRTMRRADSDLRLRRIRVVGASAAARRRRLDRVQKRALIDRAAVFDGHGVVLRLAQQSQALALEDSVASACLCPALHHTTEFTGWGPGSRQGNRIWLIRSISPHAPAMLTSPRPPRARPPLPCGERSAA